MQCVQHKDEEMAHCANKMYSHEYCCFLLHKMSVPAYSANCTLVGRLCGRQRRWLECEVSAVLKALEV